jgi:hypothetical protein
VGSWSAGPESSLAEEEFPEGYLYKLASRARDNVNPPNVEASVTTMSFIVDRSTPIVGFNHPAAASFYISSTTFVLSSGTLQETPAGMVVSGVERVEIQLEDVSAGVHVIPDASPWWGGGVWQFSAPLETASVYPSSWAYVGLPGQTDWIRGDASPDGRQYVLRVAGVDKTGNRGTFPNTLTAVRTLTFDPTKPRSWVVQPAGPNDAVATGLGTITGTAADVLVNQSSSGISAVYVSIQNDASDAGDPDNNKYWGGSGWAFSQVWIPTNFNPANGV